MTMFILEWKDKFKNIVSDKALSTQKGLICSIKKFIMVNGKYS